MELLFIFLGAVLITIMGVHLINITYHKSAPLFPSKRSVVHTALENIEYRNNQTIMELGCGTAPFLRSIHKKHPDKTFKLVGVESFSLPLIWLKLQNQFTKNKIDVRGKDIYQIHLGEADIIYCFLNVEAMKDLKPKILSECKNGTQIISYQFSLPDIPPQKTIQLTSRDKILVYQM